MSTLTAVLFDLGDTLVDLGEGGLRSTRPCASRAGL